MARERFTLHDVCLSCNENYRCPSATVTTASCLPLVLPEAPTTLLFFPWSFFLLLHLNTLVVPTHGSGQCD